MAEVQKILLMTGGGDAPGLNAVIRTAVKRAILGFDWEVVGSFEAFNSILDDPMRLTKLDLDSVRGLLMRGGTILGTSNRGGPFEFPVRGPDGTIEAVDRSDELICRVHRIGVDAVDQHRRRRLSTHRPGALREGSPGRRRSQDVRQRPGRDRDETFGFQTAVQTATEAIDRLHITAENHDRVMILKVMGRDADWIALSSGIAGGADTILIPEIPFAVDNLAMHIRRRRKKGHHFAIIVVDEGAFLRGGTPHTVKERQPGQPNPIRGGVGHWLAEEFEVCSCRDTRVCVLGHPQRGGIPSRWTGCSPLASESRRSTSSPRDDFGRMVALRSDDIVAIALTEAVAHYRGVQPEHNLIRTARGLGICFGD